MIRTRAFFFVAMVAMGGSPALAAKPDVIYSCQLFKTDAEMDQNQAREDLRLVKYGDGGKWSAIFSGKEPLEATAFDAKFGSIGGGLGLSWTDPSGAVRQGFVSFSDMRIGSGPPPFWFSMDRPSLWQPPGYGCATPEDLAKDAK